MMKVKCRYCDIKDTEREDMKVEEISTGKNVQRKYYHEACYPKYLTDKEFKEKEQTELDKLVETIMEVHKIKSVPKQFYPFIQDLRNGTVLYGKQKKKKYKQGYPYSLIQKTYIFCQESIEYWQKNKNFESTMGELKYCWIIINDKVNVVKKREEKKELLRAKKKAEEKHQLEHENIPSQNKPNVAFKKQKREDDIADFL